MAITLTDSPEETREGETIRFFSAHNPLLFEFTAGAGETSLQVKVTTPAPADIGVIKTLPFASDNTLLVDVAYILRSQLSITDYTDDSRINTDWELVGAELVEPFQLAYRVGGTGSYTQLATSYDAVQAVRQLGSTYGATMAEYLPILSTGPTVDATAKFMTRFEKPVLFYYQEGLSVSVWQIGLAFLMPDDGFSVFDCIKADYQKNGVQVGEEIIQPATAITSSAVHVPIPLIEDYVRSSDTVFLQVGEYATGPALINACTENLEIEIKRVCQNPIALRWQNTLGGFDVWVFEGNTPREFSTSNEGDFGIFPTDIKTATSTRGMSKKRAFPSISVVADNLTLQQAKGLEDLLISPNIRLFTGELTAGTTFDTWQGVTLEAGSFDSYDTFNQRHRLELTILLPDVYTIGA